MDTLPLWIVSAATLLLVVAAIGADTGWVVLPARDRTRLATWADVDILGGPRWLAGGFGWPCGTAEF